MSLINRLCDGLHRLVSRERYHEFLYPYHRSNELDQDERRKEDDIRLRLFNVEQELDRIAHLAEERQS